MCICLYHQLDNSLKPKRIELDFTGGEERASKGNAKVFFKKKNDLEPTEDRCNGGVGNPENLPYGKGIWAVAQRLPTASSYTHLLQVQLTLRFPCQRTHKHTQLWGEPTYTPREAILCIHLITSLEDSADSNST